MYRNNPIKCLFLWLKFVSEYLYLVKSNHLINIFHRLTRDFAVNKERCSVLIIILFERHCDSMKFSILNLRFKTIYKPSTS